MSKEDWFWALAIIACLAVSYTMGTLFFYMMLAMTVTVLIFWWVYTYGPTGDFSGMDHYLDATSRYIDLMERSGCIKKVSDNHSAAN